MYWTGLADKDSQEMCLYSGWRFHACREGTRVRVRSALQPVRTQKLQNLLKFIVLPYFSRYIKLIIVHHSLFAVYNCLISFCVILDSQHLNILLCLCYLRLECGIWLEFTWTNTHMRARTHPSYFWTQYHLE